MPSKTRLLVDPDKPLKYYYSSRYTGQKEIERVDPLDAILGDVDELQNKPRRFFETLLYVVDQNYQGSEASKRFVLEGIEQWLNAIDKSAYGAIKALADEDVVALKEWCKIRLALREGKN